MQERAGQFIASVIATVNTNTELEKCDPGTILNAAMTAASLNLPVNSSLGYAYIVPYKGKAQFQIGWKGFVQLALRTGQYKRIAAVPLYEGQLVEINPLMGNTYDFTIEPDKSKDPIGYVALLQLNSGFIKDLYMTHDEVNAHGKRYSQSYKKGYGNWVDDFESMALKTVIKLLLSKWGVVSTELQKAIETDQAVIQDDSLEYLDNKKPTADEIATEKERERVKEFINTAPNLKTLIEGCEGYIDELDEDDELRELYKAKLKELD